MNQNKAYYLVGYGLGLIFFLFSFSLLAYIDFYEIRPDPQWSYLPIFRGEKPIIDWHSSLFMYEGFSPGVCIWQVWEILDSEHSVYFGL